MKIEKFRPCLTSKQISHILSLCKNNLSEESFLLIGVLAPFKAKIENNSNTPSYSMQENKSVIASLGYENMEEYANLSHMERRQKAYDKWINNSDSCNAAELEMVRDYKAGAGLLSPEEIEQLNAETFAKYGLPY